jgi:hypothetical protein
LLAAAAGLDEPTIIKFMEQLRAHHAADAWRCSVLPQLDGDGGQDRRTTARETLCIVTTCQPCYERIMAGTQTDAMRKNLRAYVGEVVK